MAGERPGHLPAGLDVPEVQVQIRAGPPASIPDDSAPAEHAAAVGRDGEGERRAPMALDPAERATCRDVPDPEVRAIPGDDDPRTVRCGRKSMDPAVGADPSSLLAPTGDVPDAD